MQMPSIDWEAYWKEKASSYKTINERNLIASKMVGTGKKVLDVGCGHGELMDLLKPNNNVIGMDFNMKMIEENLKKESKVVWGTAEDIPFPNEHFDAVCALGLIEYLSSYKYFINEVHRVLKPKGTAIISFRNSLFSKWSGSEHEPERKSYDPDKVSFPNFRIDELKFFHEHLPHKVEDPKYYHSGFIIKMVKT